MVSTAVREKINVAEEDVRAHIDRIIIGTSNIRVIPLPDRGKSNQIDIAWAPKVKDEARVQLSNLATNTDQKLLKSIVRAHAWLNDLSSGRHESIESLAATANVHPKLVRQELRLAFLAPRLTASALGDEPPITLGQIPKCLPLSWREHYCMTGIGDSQVNEIACVGAPGLRAERTQANR